VIGEIERGCVGSEGVRHTDKRPGAEGSLFGDYYVGRRGRKRERERERNTFIV